MSGRQRPDSTSKLEGGPGARKNISTIGIERGEERKRKTDQLEKEILAPRLEAGLGEFCSGR